ncbi:MAG: SUMF1/EgtB/PvdO family nonheme iron enzyme, partial [Anaerolineae bacterium]|nr:SUMF1/EgtB/PvdO family nonheme iron enzyme [Anaerolineae bacterium]
GALNDRIARLTADADLQRLLLLDIEELFDDEIHRAHAPEVLARLIERDDILIVRILKRAQTLQARHADPSVPPSVVDPPPPLVIPSAPPRLVLPDPFAWIDIPAGKVTLREGYDGKGYIPKGKTQTFPVPAFAIAKYPITNAQFRVFVEAQGYQTERWWTPDGWRARGANDWTQPRFWGDADREPFNRLDHPVVGVSWFEAAAFCLWLSEAWSARIMLPTEQMWQRAAQGDDGRAYPWGKDWDATRCQNSVKPRDSKHTAPVTQHAGRDKGDSPFEVSDMAGNVWEWCLTDYESGEQDENKSANMRVLRGGSWYYFNSVGFRVDHRLWGSPVYGINNWGFRIARF